MCIRDSSCAVFIRGAGGVSCIHGGGVGEKFQQARSVFPVEALVVGVESLGIRAQDRNAEAAAVAASFPFGIGGAKQGQRAKVGFPCESLVLNQ